MLLKRNHSEPDIDCTQIGNYYISSFKYLRGWGTGLVLRRSQVGFDNQLHLHRQGMCVCRGRGRGGWFSAAKYPDTMGALLHNYLWGLALLGAEYESGSEPWKKPRQNCYFLYSLAHQSPGTSGLQPLYLIRTYIKASDRRQGAFRAPHRHFLEQQPSLHLFSCPQRYQEAVKFPPQ